MSKKQQINHFIDKTLFGNSEFAKVLNCYIDLEVPEHEKAGLYVPQKGLLYPFEFPGWAMKAKHDRRLHRTISTLLNDMGLYRSREIMKKLEKDPAFKRVKDVSALLRVRFSNPDGFQRKVCDEYQKLLRESKNGDKKTTTIELLYKKCYIEVGNFVCYYQQGSDIGWKGSPTLSGSVFWDGTGGFRGNKFTGSQDRMGAPSQHRTGNMRVTVDFEETAGKIDPTTLRVKSFSATITVIDTFEGGYGEHIFSISGTDLPVKKYDPKWLEFRLDGKKVYDHIKYKEQSEWSGIWLKLTRIKCSPKSYVRIWFAVE